MTLLELLVKELSKRGGWPEGAVECFVHTGTEDYGYFYDKNGGGGYNWINTTIVKHVETQSGGVAGCSVTREQYEAAIAAKHPVWNGEWLPPVGVKCEWQDCNTKKWITVRVVYSSEWITIISEDKDDDAVELAIENYGDKGRRKFRPLRTEEDSKRDETLCAMRNCVSNFNNTSVIHAIEQCYDAIAAGKIPGVEISK